MLVSNAEYNDLGSVNNVATRQRRVASRILYAASIIQNYGRRGRANFAVMNTKMLTSLVDNSQFMPYAITNTFSQDSDNLYFAGTLGGLAIYVNPYMNDNDNRILVGRKGDANEPGVKFMPYILADTVQITAEGTMAPKVLINSRYSIVDAGFNPEMQYLTFLVDVEQGII